MITRTKDVYLFQYYDSTFSNWAATPYELDGVEFLTSEHGLMYEKAMLFDKSVIPAILAAQHPRDVKVLGRMIQNFDSQVWDEQRVDLFIPHLIAKFEQNKTALDEILSTEGLEIAEASPSDTIWGIGVAADDVRAFNKETWNGYNLLGEAIMCL